MHLKRLQLTGFKTFADRTEIVFSPGVTAIVGPNGSGKSNIADAVLWALGEQKASAVRGVRNQDVIFNGSAKRKQTGLAEVSLTVDNSDGTLSLSFDEVTVTRRALRSGDSEYSINKSACRLKDIYELFLDTGVGREAYALVNQSEIDAVLTAAPEERRGLFEEAAGIKKYRVKKREALRKLDATELNLSRITDILSEIETQLAPLHIQSQLARRFLVLKEELTQLEENYLITELRTADLQWAAARQARSRDERQAQEYTERLAVDEQALAQATASAAEAERELESFRHRHERLRSENERLHNERRLSQERLQALTVQSELHQREMDDLGPRLEIAIEHVGTLEFELHQAGQLAGDHTKEQTEGEDRLRILTEQIKKLQSSIEKKRRDVEAATRRRIMEEAEYARAEARVSEAAAQLTTLAEERQRLSDEIAVYLEARKSAEDGCAVAERALAATVDEAAALREEKAAAQYRVEQARLYYEAVRGEGLSIAARLKSQRELEDAHEGYFTGVKAVLSAARAGRVSGRYLAVADAFTAPAHLVTALDVAFGSSLQDVITDTEEEAKTAIAYLKDGSLGRATFLPLQRMVRNRSEVRLEPGRHAGFLGAALDLISFDSDLRPALESLVGRVILCETLENAIALSNKASNWSRIVTIAGELLAPSGAITGGSAHRRGGSLLERKSDIGRLAAQLEDQNRAEARYRNAVADAQAALSAADNRLASVNDKFSEARVQLSTAKQTLERARRDLMSATDRESAQRRRKENAQELVRIAHERLDNCRKSIEASDELRDSAVDDADEQHFAALTSQRDAIASQITQERIGRAALDEKAAGLLRAQRLAKMEVEQLKNQRVRRLSQIDSVEIDRAKLTELLQSMETALLSSDAALLDAHGALQQRQEVRKQLAAEVAAASAAVRDLQNARADALGTARKNELTEARFEIMRQQAAAKLLEEYDVTAEQALALPESPAIAPDGPREVARLRRELRAIGDVNVGAVEEFDRLSERFASMTAQKSDAQLAKDKVYEAIREIDESTKDVFMSTFYAVESAFKSLFQRLFNGGTADLKLTDPADLLETGVDIFVQLPGKKQQNLQLLSGGERALTAIALLFAFLKVRPAPFCLLDEVDAPLDGANIERFADLLRDFGASTQFLVITHNPATMEAAGVWYGVTMQEPGVSRVLSLQVPQPLELRPEMTEQQRN